jgi:hypothetical protein
LTSEHLLMPHLRTLYFRQFKHPSPVALIYSG